MTKVVVSLNHVESYVDSPYLIESKKAKINPINEKDKK